MSKESELDLQERCIDFAVRILKLTEALPNTRSGNHIRGKYLEPLRKMTLHSNGLFCVWTASGSINRPRTACFAFLASRRNARFRCYDSF